MDFYSTLLARRLGGSSGGGGGGGGGGTSTERKDVNFYDYDGTLLYSYNKNELTQLPENPTHSGLTAQGWNWTLEDIQSQLADYPNMPVDVGQMYITDDGKTRIYITLQEGRTSPYLGFCPNGTVTVDWGDGSTDTVTGTSISSHKATLHEYQSAGDYVITLDVNGEIAFVGASNATSKVLGVNGNGSQNINRVYTNAITKVELGKNIRVKSYAFLYCGNMKTITMPSGLYSSNSVMFDSGIFQQCRSLKAVVFPSNITSINSYALDYCSMLEKVVLPYGVTTIYSTFCEYTALESITLPKTLTALQTNAFRECQRIENIVVPGSISMSSSANVFMSEFGLKTAVISEGITSIPNSCFQNCFDLVRVSLPNGLKSLGTNSFGYCGGLASLSFPSTLETINNTCFQYCYGIKEYHFKSTTPPSLANANAFTSIPSDCIIYVPSESVDDYKAATNWSNYASQIQGE